MGQRNSESTLYQKMLAQVANQYADMRPADMTADTDASRLFSTDEVVPGMFTRQAWEQAVQPAIEKVVAERRDEMDWVLSDTKQTAAQSTLPEALRAGLAERYFADFSGASAGFPQQSALAARGNPLRCYRPADPDGRCAPVAAGGADEHPERAGANRPDRGSHRRFAGQIGRGSCSTVTTRPSSINGPARAVLWMPPSGPYWRCWTIATAGRPPAVLACRPS